MSYFGGIRLFYVSKRSYPFLISESHVPIFDDVGKSHHLQILENRYFGGRMKFLRFSWVWRTDPACHYVCTCSRELLSENVELLMGKDLLTTPK